MAELELKMATGKYWHTRPIMDKVVGSERVTFEHEDVPVIISAFRRMIRGLEFDVSEMALSTYLCARAHGIPITALPIFLVRAFHHGSIVYNTKSGITSPKDLEGKKVGLRGYTVTTGVWVRGILRSQYGVDLEKVTWALAGDEHVADYKAPSNVVPAPGDGDIGALLNAGELDAAIGVFSGDDIAPLIPDAADAAAAAFKQNGIYPINHTLVVKNELLEAHPWLAQDLFATFKAAKEHFLSHPSPAEDDSLPESIMRKARDVVGDDPIPYGLEANRKALEAFIEFNVDQKVIPNKVTVEEVFEPSTLKLEA